MQMRQIVRPRSVDCSTLLGQMLDIDDSYLILDNPHEDARVCKADSGDLLMHVRRGIISEPAWRLGHDCFLAAGRKESTNRGAAAGVRHRSIVAGAYEQAGRVRSGIVGYMDSPNNKSPCRLTAFSRANLAQYEAGIPFIRELDRAYRDTVPDRYERQLAAAGAHGFHIPGTAFSTVTVNYNFRTAVHVDSGDYRDGFGTLCVVSTPGCTGGLLMFPGFRVAVRLYNGDFLAMDVHEHHCNSPISLAAPTDYRLSFVSYLRERLARCPDANRRLLALHGNLDGGRWGTEQLISGIFGGGGLPEKRILGHGPQGLAWWAMEDERWQLVYRGKRYTLLDKLTGQRINNLGPAWEHVVRVNSRPG